MIDEKIETVAGLCEGRVLEQTGQDYSVALDDGVFCARRAPGCLLAPEEGDVALLYSRPGGGYMILSILERREDAPAQVSVSGDLQLSCGGSLHLQGGQRIDLTAGVVQTTAADCAINAHNLQVHAQKADAVVGRFSFWAQTLDCAIRFIQQKLGRSFRSVETTDETQAAQIHLKAEGLYQVESQYTVMVSDKVTRIDGEQIQMG